MELQATGKILELSVRQYKRVLAIGDVHGCLAQLRDLLAMVKPTKDDLVVTLGDYTDRGDDSRKVIEKLIELHRDPEINIVSLRGNHDDLMLMVAAGIEDFKRFYRPSNQDPWFIVDCYSPSELWLNNSAILTLFSYGFSGERIEENDLTAAIREHVPPEHLAFLRETCVDALEMEDYIFIHGGLRPDLPLADQVLFDLHWLPFDSTQPHISGKKVICGHTIQRDWKVRDIKYAAYVDTGAFLDLAGGRLSCLDVLSGQVWQSDGLPEEEKIRHASYLLSDLGLSAEDRKAFCKFLRGRSAPALLPGDPAGDMRVWRTDYREWNQKILGGKL